MSDKRSTTWTNPATPSIRYGPFARISDWWCGGRDGRKGIPSVPEEARPGTPQAELSTPRMMFLGQLGVGRIEKEWITFQIEVAGLEAKLRDAIARRDALALEPGGAARLAAAHAEIAHLEEQIKIGLRVTRRRASMIEAYVRRRCAAYLTRLVRRHPDGARLNHLMRPRWPDQVDWARASLGPDVPAAVPRAGVLGVRGS
ncbi:hypothetical protein RB614_14250 [Phytohabitans sp. ZYX-F-186]|uniref:Uncharacterized protein n=1 Tax=Phytohabitans maris TaxID=3071409 RepID=A0ABU0ZGT5_9ACTN|nr:hypothetical protein [Phytohabitans sp. ZYX-F-186]MDQ7905676.1 hypothetical protein [Phytohabitans sp. ZYX-F-186]